MAGDKFGSRCTYRYDGARLVEIECSWWDDVFGDGASGTDTTTWTDDADGQPVRTDNVFDGGGYTLRWSWQLDTDPITFWSGPGTGQGPGREEAAYDRATFAFLPAPGSRGWAAELGLIRKGDTTFTWSGSGTSLTRTASNGHVAMFELDDRGRIVRKTAGEAVETWSFDGDLLRGHTYLDDHAREYGYDRAGNVATSHLLAKEEQRTAYSYDCW
jgi:uncharacterized protein RhaS with RHS repeats